MFVISLFWLRRPIERIKNIFVSEVLTFLDYNSINQDGNKSLNFARN
jgi:hypothetical protein